jgi:hypothetical protein
MTLNWFLFFPALALLLFPVDALLTTRRLKLRAFEHINFQSGSWARLPSAWSMPASWMDPLRAFLGIKLLGYAWVVDDFADGLASWIPVLTLCALLTLAMGVQVHTRRNLEVLLAPIGYVAGMWLGLLSPVVAVLAVVVGVGGVIAFRSWAAFFICGAAYVSCAGFWIMGKNLYVPLCAGLAMLPWLMSAITNRTLVQPLRAPGYSAPAPVRDTSGAPEPIKT